MCTLRRKHGNCLQISEPKTTDITGHREYTDKSVSRSFYCLQLPERQQQRSTIATAALLYRPRNARGQPGPHGEAPLDGYINWYADNDRLEPDATRSRNGPATRCRMSCIRAGCGDCGSRRAARTSPSQRNRCRTSHSGASTTLSTTFQNSSRPTTVRS